MIFVDHFFFSAIKRALFFVISQCNVSHNKDFSGIRILFLRKRCCRAESNV